MAILLNLVKSSPIVTVTMAGDVNSRSTTLTTPHDRPDMRIIVKEDKLVSGMRLKIRCAAKRSVKTEI